MEGSSFDDDRYQGQHGTDGRSVETDAEHPEPHASQDSHHPTTADELTLEACQTEGEPIGSSALPGQFGFAHEVVVPGLWRAVIDEDVHASVDRDLKRRREVRGAPHARAALTPDEHPFSGLHGRQSCRLSRPNRQLGVTRSASWPSEPGPSSRPARSAELPARSGPHRGNVGHSKRRHCVQGAILIAAGAEPEDTGWWSVDDLWRHALDAVAVFMRAAADRHLSD